MNHFIPHSAGLKCILFGLAFCLLNVSLLIGQEGQGNERPKIGLVLSGGGAKGMAHIGALKVIERAGIKIDYIGGSSMGAIVGALYASGYTAMELDSMFNATNFGSLIQDNLPRSAKTFYEKEDSERYALSLPFDNFKVSVPPAYSGGQNIYNELVKLLYHVKDVKDFNKLPTPFVCVATDIETGKQVILNKGYLPEAVLASGTLPSLFEPTIIDDKVLIDGGVVNNYPIDEVLAMGADLIIGVDVQHDLSDRESLISATEILLQINNYRTVADMKQKSERTDIYIKPQIEQYSVIEFNKLKAIIKTGEDAAFLKFEELKALSNGSGKEKTVNYKTDENIVLNRLMIEGNTSHTRGYVKGKLRFNLNEPITFHKLQQGIGNLAATGNFKTIRYKLLTNVDDGEDLVLPLDETPTTSFLRLGAHYDDLYKSGAIINLTKRKVLSRDDVASFDLILGDNIRYNFEYYMDKGTYWSFGINSRFNDFEQEIDFDLIGDNFDVTQNTRINSINLSVSDFTNQIYVQTVVKEEFAFTLGAEYKDLKYSTRTFGEITDPNVPINTQTENGRTYFEKSNYISVFGALKLDTYDDKYFPKRGLYFNGDMHYYLLSSDFNDNFKDFSVSKARMGMAFPLFKKLSLNLETEGGFKLGTSKVTSFDFLLGGFGTDFINNFAPFIGYDFISLFGNSYVKAYGRLDYEFAQKHHALFSANFANVDDDLFRTGDWFKVPMYSGFGVGYGWQSFLGPINLLYSWSPETDNSQFFVSVGYWF
ncbi:patatin-like phospholipase family protein [Maribacter confluentis]|uniref:Patatin-like phospholipase family protein n=1 Tax=Maribacter confluentis TaxID=1656093 RepID=A0ABT8RP53_9FLAO|nr:patatin-like phospholipase family protein [Maribacter confluentis]MDO1512646.1 patatin-like phospholipase family protein [Maribacter confluentis]